MVDKLVELPEFSTRLLRVRSACLAVGEVIGRAAVAQEVAVGTYDPTTVGGPPRPLDSVQTALESFVAADYVDMLGLGDLGVGGVRALLESP